MVEGCGRLWAIGMLVFSFALSQPGYASEGIGIRGVTLEPADDAWKLSADFDIQFTPTLQEAVSRGVPLYFVIEFEVRQPRWYWFDKKNVYTVRERRISYAPLTQEYRLSTGNYFQHYKTFSELRYQLERLRGWEVTGRDSLRAGEKYDIAVRMRLDTSLLPKPFQISSLTSREWSLSSDWHRWSLAP